MAKGDVHTMWDGEKGDWYNKREGNTNASSRHDNKADASARGQDLARGTGTEWLGHKQADNTINDRNTYGKDPHPPKG
ncbi:DUF2188 domain-containing protein [Demequina sediminicola]|uniref:DUF2188 domain-containing protein n=1 Tax=Demequina sediminicola TaxID=1095026 RepID=UPI000785354C|nr:DUF2188 domain-containing protein [Demequina sediminicola]